MNSRVDAHRHLVRVFAGDLEVHVEKVAVPFPDDVAAEALDGVGEIEITPRPPGPTPRPSSQTILALREATSRGTRLPKLGYLRSR